MVTEPVSLGDLISELYVHYLAIYRDEELASIATAAAINDLLEQNRFVAEQAELGCNEPDQ